MRYTRVIFILFIICSQGACLRKDTRSWDGLTADTIEEQCEMPKGHGVRISFDEATLLLRERATPASMLSVPLLTVERAHELSDGRVLIVYEEEKVKYGVVYSSKQALETAWANKDAERDPGFRAGPTKKQLAHPVSKKEVKKLLGQTGIAPDADLSGRLISAQAYQLPDGGILLVDDQGKGVIWESRQAIVDILETPVEFPSGHMFGGMLAGGKDFPVHIAKLIDQLAVKLKLRREELDFSDESMRKIHIAACRLFDPEERVGPELFPNIVAYSCEGMVRLTRGKLEMRLDDIEGKTWVPRVITPAGDVLEPWPQIRDDFYDEEGYGPGRFCLRETVETILKPTFRGDHWIRAMGTPLSKEETEKLIRQPGVKDDSDLAGFDLVIDRGYQLRDGRILLVYRNGKGAIWESKKALFDARDAMVEQMQQMRQQMKSP